MEQQPQSQERQGSTSAAENSSQFTIVIGLMLGMLICGLDASIVNIMLPTLQTVFKINVSQSMMLATIYLTMLASLQLLFGRCADIFEASEVFLFGVVLFFVGSLGCALSQTFIHILVGRLVQGIGGAMIAASFGAIILNHIPRKKIGSTIGIVLMVMSCGTIIGPPLGGYLAEDWSWRYAFLINIPICLIAISALIIHIRTFSTPAKEGFWKKLRLLDFKGGILSILMFGSLPIALSTFADAGWHSPRVWGLLTIFLLSLVLFIVVEKRTEHPLIQLSLFRDQNLNIMLAIKLLLFMLLNGVMITFPFFLTRSLGMTPSQAGLMMLINAIGMAIATPLTGRLTDHSDSKVILLISSACLLLVSVGTLLFPVSPSNMMLGVVLALLGITVATVMVSSTTILLEQAPKGQTGIFSAFNTLSASVGGALGLSLFSSLYTTGAMGKSGAAAANGGFSSALVGITICAALLLTFSVIFIKRKGATMALTTTHARES